MMVEQWQLGVCTSCFSSLLGTLGVQLRILALAYEDEVEIRRARCLQLMGWIFWITGQALGQVAIMLTPATIIACVAFSSSLLCNAILAPLVLHEELTWSHGLGILLLSVGGCTVTEFSTHAAEEYTLAQLYAFAQRPPFVVVIAGCFAVALTLFVRAAYRTHLDVLSFAFAFALCGAVDLIFTKSTLLVLRLYAVTAADTPSTSILVAFVTTMVLFHLFVLGFQITSTHYGEALQNMPLFLGSGAMMQVALCGIFFNEFSEFGGERLTFFLAGFILMLAGLGVTSRATAAKVALPSVNNEPLVKPTVENLPVISSGRFSTKIAQNLSETPRNADLLLVVGMERTAMCFGTAWGPHPIRNPITHRLHSDKWRAATDGMVATFPDTSDSLRDRAITEPNLPRHQRLTA